LQILGLSHIGIAAKDSSAARQFFTQLFGSSSEETVAVQKTHTVMFDSPCTTRIELLEDASHDQSGPIHHFIQKRGGGIHHLAIRVDSIQKAIEFAKKQGWHLIDENYKIGAHKSKTVFYPSQKCWRRFGRVRRGST
jgi:methylmalonyl-CoA/ethylmalonyl-CoA epimerase